MKKESKRNLTVLLMLLVYAFAALAIANHIRHGAGDADGSISITRGKIEANDGERTIGNIYYELYTPETATAQNKALLWNDDGTPTARTGKIPSVTGNWSIRCSC